MKQLACNYTIDNCEYLIPGGLKMEQFCVRVWSNTEADKVKALLVAGGYKCTGSNTCNGYVDMWFEVQVE